MKTLLIKNGKIIIDTLNEVVFDGDLLIEKGRIKRIDKNINDNVDQIIDAKGNYVCPGFIDIHTHCYPVGVYGLTPDVLGVERYSSTIVDAGTSGSLTFEDFKNNYIDKAKTKVFAFKKKDEMPYPTYLFLKIRFRHKKKFYINMGCEETDKW